MINDKATRRSVVDRLVEHSERGRDESDNRKTGAGDQARSPIRAHSNQVNTKPELGDDAVSGVVFAPTHHTTKTTSEISRYIS